MAEHEHTNRGGELDEPVRSLRPSPATIARRRDELPDTIAAMRRGLLSIDQVDVIARHVPAAYDTAAADLATNLCCLCRTHHRQHHPGQIHITGNADQPDGLTITDHTGRPLTPAAQPHEIDPHQPPEHTATQHHIPTTPYHPATGEPVRARDIYLAPRPSRAGPPHHTPPDHQPATPDDPPEEPDLPDDLAS